MISEKNDENRHQLRGQLTLLEVAVRSGRNFARGWFVDRAAVAPASTKIPEANKRRANVVTIVKQSVT